MSATLEINPTLEEYVETKTIVEHSIEEWRPIRMQRRNALAHSTAEIDAPSPLSNRGHFQETTPSFIEPEATLNTLHGDRPDIKAIKRIRELGLYSENWDGTGAIPPTGQAINDAEKFLRTMLDMDIALPHISLAADGEINFLWKLKEIRLDLGFYGDQTYSYYGKDKDEKEYMEDEASVLNLLPEEIMHYLQGM